MPRRTLSRAKFRALLALAVVLLMVGFLVQASTPRERYLAIALIVLGLVQAVREWRRAPRV